MYLKSEANLPLATEQLNKVTQAIQDLNLQQIMWVSGYLAGLSVCDSDKQNNNSPQSELTILYASQTGNCKLLAENYAQACQSQGINFQLVSLADFKPRNITKEKNLVIIISTHGEGEAPDDAEIFYEYLFSSKKPRLKTLNYSLLALGDSSYEQFCKTGIEIDLQLQKLGANRVVERVDCDLDFEDSALIWQEKTHDYFSKIVTDSDNNVTPLSLLKSQPRNNFNRNNTYSAELLTIQKITTQNSVKNIYHIELDIENSDIDYQVGDSLGIVTHNNSETINSIIQANGFDTNKPVNYKGQQLPFSKLLTSLEITLINKSFLKFFANLSQSDALIKIIEDHQLFLEFVSKRQLSDVLYEYPTQITEQQLIENLIKISPRLYSISSSSHSNEGEVHLTVALVKSLTKKPNNGLVSGLLCDQSTEGDSVEIYIENNKNFKLPKDDQTPIIMISAGTGIAPFRGFLQERHSLKATGENWLFFGNPSFENDFLYQLELQKLYKDKVLTKIDLAFSRDQKQKIYVQHKIQQNAEEIWQWIDKGAHLYICGNKDNMAKSVETELLSLIEVYGHKNADEAKNYLTTLKRNRRYQKDVY